MIGQQAAVQHTYGKASLEGKATSQARRPPFTRAGFLLFFEVATRRNREDQRVGAVNPRKPKHRYQEARQDEFMGSVPVGIKVR
jgi:hypothetical protein